MFVVELSINENLTLGNVSGQIRNWMGDIIIRHCQNWQLCDRTIDTFDSTGSLVQGTEIGIHITWETSSSRHFFSGSGDFFKRFGVGRHISHNGEDMHFLLIGQVFGSGEGKSRGNNSKELVFCVGN